MNIAVILAAGEGTRMKSKKHKVLMEVAGIPMISHVLRATEGSIDSRVVIVGRRAECLMEAVGSDVHFRSQPMGEDMPYGTGFAVMQAVDLIGDDDNVIILCGDTPLLKSSTVDDFMRFFIDGGYAGAVLTARLDNPSGYGRIKRNSCGNVERIIEQKDASESERLINEVNSGIFAFKGVHLKSALTGLNTDNASNELYLTDTLEIMVSNGLSFGAFVADDSEELFGVNDRAALAKAESCMRDRIIARHMKNGVSFISPETTYVDADSVIGMDSVIYPNCYIVRSTIGEDVILYEGCRIEDSEISDSAIIRQSFIERSSVGAGVTMGPFAHLRPNCKVGDNAHIGNFVELKNTRFGEGSKAGHLAYIGDADVGSGVNIGCGVVFVNYDGVRKHRSVIGDRAFIGSNANLVAPVNVGDGGFVAAGSTITSDVSENSLAIERSEQKEIVDWVLRRKNYKK